MDDKPRRGRKAVGGAALFGRQRVSVSVNTALHQERARKRFSGWRREFNFSHREALVGLIAKRSGASRAEVFMLMSELRSVANKARPRGFISDWDLSEGSYACEIAEEIVGRIVEELYRCGWLEQEAIVTWSETQPEDEDPTATERKRRERARKRAMRWVAGQVAAGKITRDQRDVLERELRDSARPAELCTGWQRHGVTWRDIVTVTPDSDGDKKQERSGQPSEITAEIVQPHTGDCGEIEIWLALEGTRIVAERMRCLPHRAKLDIGRWRKELADDVGLLARLIHDADTLGLSGGKFSDRVRSEILRLRYEERGATLPFPPMLAAKRASGS